MRLKLNFCFAAVSLSLSLLLSNFSHTVFAQTKAAGLEEFPCRNDISDVIEEHKTTLTPISCADIDVQALAELLDSDLWAYRESSRHYGTVGELARNLLVHAVVSCNRGNEVFAHIQGKATSCQTEFLASQISSLIGAYPPGQRRVRLAAELSKSVLPQIRRVGLESILHIVGKESSTSLDCIEIPLGKALTEEDLMNRALALNIMVKLNDAPRDSAKVALEILNKQNDSLANGVEHLVLEAIINDASNGVGSDELTKQVKKRTNSENAAIFARAHLALDKLTGTNSGYRRLIDLICDIELNEYRRIAYGFAIMELSHVQLSDVSRLLKALDYGPEKTIVKAAIIRMTLTAFHDRESRMSFLEIASESNSESTREASREIQRKLRNVHDLLSSGTESE